MSTVSEGYGYLTLPLLTRRTMMMMMILTIIRDVNKEVTKSGVPWRKLLTVSVLFLYSDVANTDLVCFVLCLSWWYSSGAIISTGSANRSIMPLSPFA